MSTIEDLLRAPSHQRPTYVASSLECLDAAASELRVEPGKGWTVAVDGGDLHLTSTPHGDCTVGTGDESMAALRGVLDIAWAHPGFGTIVGLDAVARRIVAQWVPTA